MPGRDIERRYVYLRGISMEPTLRHGDLLRARYAPVEELRSGDIVGLPSRRHGSMVVHRVSRILEGDGESILLVTSGDLTGQDEPVPLRPPLLKVESVLRNGVWRRPRNSTGLKRIIDMCPKRIINLTRHCRLLMRYLRLDRFLLE